MDGSIETERSKIRSPFFIICHHSRAPSTNKNKNHLGPLSYLLKKESEKWTWTYMYHLQFLLQDDYCKTVLYSHLWLKYLFITLSTFWATEDGQTLLYTYLQFFDLNNWVQKFVPLIFGYCLFFNWGRKCLFAFIWLGTSLVEETLNHAISNITGFNFSQWDVTQKRRDFSRAWPPDASLCWSSEWFITLFVSVNTPV